jgi:hypothetical protein
MIASTITREIDLAEHLQYRRDTTKHLVGVVSSG